MELLSELLGLVVLSELLELVPVFEVELFCGGIIFGGVKLFCGRIVVSAGASCNRIILRRSCICGVIICPIGGDGGGVEAVGTVRRKPSKKLLQRLPTHF